jgi:ABC-type transport system involved in multi-copper enzyme maturation permease subunit
MGINPIEYRPWKGERSNRLKRLWTISRGIVKHKLSAKSKGILIILILGMFLVHALPMLFYTMAEHEELTTEFMVGNEWTEDERPDDGGNGTANMTLISPDTYLDITGMVMVAEDVIVDGSFQVEGIVVINGHLELDGYITGSGTVSTFNGLDINENLTASGGVSLYGVLFIDGTIQGNGTMDTGYLEETSVQPGAIIAVAGTGTVSGNGTNPNIEPEEPIDYGPGDFGPGDFAAAYLKNELFIIFTLLLVALVTSDLISDDIGSNSFVLYFSRPVRTEDYLLGKFGGAAIAMGVFCMLPPFIMALAMIGTQSSDQYGESFKVFGQTIVAGILTTILFVPFGLMMSSFTKRKSYAAVGTFMGLFVLFIISGFFTMFESNWVVVNPAYLLFLSYDVIFGHAITGGISGGLVAASVFCIFVVPLAMVYLRIYLKGVGK